MTSVSCIGGGRGSLMINDISFMYRGWKRESDDK